MNSVVGIQKACWLKMMKLTKLNQGCHKDFLFLGVCNKQAGNWTKIASQVKGHTHNSQEKNLHLRTFRDSPC